MLVSAAAAAVAGSEKIATLTIISKGGVVCFTLLCFALGYIVLLFDSVFVCSFFTVFCGVYLCFVFVLALCLVCVCVCFFFLFCVYRVCSVGSFRFRTSNFVLYNCTYFVIFVSNLAAVRSGAVQGQRGINNSNKNTPGQMEQSFTHILPEG
ncbi:unnamed protein product [Laminaria digitata]